MPLLGGESEPGTFRPIKVDNEGRVQVLVSNTDPLRVDTQPQRLFAKMRNSKRYSLGKFGEQTHEFARPTEPTRLIFAIYPPNIVATVKLDNHTPLTLRTTGSPVTLDLIDVSRVTFSNRTRSSPVWVSVWEMEVVPVTR